MLKFYKSFVLNFLIFITFFSCSLNYNEEDSEFSSAAPEFVFKNAKFSRYESTKLKMQLQAQELEQYRDNDSSYAKDVNFFNWDDNGILETEGKCLLLAINSKDEIYTMFTDILIQNYPQKLELKAQNIKWNSKTEQLTSSTSETVSIKKDNIELEGKGFSASGLSRKFNFTGQVKGSLSIEDEETDEISSNSEDSEVLIDFSDLNSSDDSTNQNLAIESE